MIKRRIAEHGFFLLPEGVCIVASTAMRPQPANTKTLLYWYFVVCVRAASGIKRDTKTSS